MADPSKISGKVYQSGGANSQFKIKGLGNERYWVKVGRFGPDKGKIEIWNEEGLQLDSRIGVIDPDGTIHFNEGPGGVGLRQNEDGKWVDEREIIREQVASIREQARLTVIEDAQRDNQVDSPEEAIKEADDVFSGSNSATNKAADLEVQGMLKEALLGYENIQNREGTNKVFPNLKYPQNLHEKLQDCIKFSVMEYKPSKFKQGSGVLGGFEEHDRGGGGSGKEWKDRNKIGSVVLPIPGGIREDNTVDWGEGKMNPIEAAMAKIGLDFLTSNDAIGTVGKVGEAIQKRQREVGGGLALAITSAAVGGQTGLLTRQTGAVLNPNMQLLFKSPQLRPFVFEFQLTPREPKEAREVMKIIRLFKQAMAPIRTDSMLFLKSPHTFRLEYLHQNQTHPYVGSIKECALLACSVDYTPNNNYSTYEDGVMTAYTLSLQFKELVPIYNDDYGSVEKEDQFAANLNFSGAMSSEEQSPRKETATSSTFTTNSTELGLGANDLSGSSSNLG